MIRFGTWSLILLVGAMQGLFVSIGLVVRPTNRAANVFLAGLIALLSLKLVPYIIGYAGFYEVYPWLDLAPFDLSLGFGPLLFLYLSRLTLSELPKGWRWHLLPLAAEFLVYSVLFVQPMAFKDQFEATIGPTFNTVDNFLTCVSFVAYLVLTWRAAKTYEQSLADRFANPDLHRVRPLRLNLAVISILLLAFACAKLWTIFAWPLSYYQMFPLYLLLTASVYAFGFIAFRFAQVDLPAVPEAAEPRETDWKAMALDFTQALEASSFWSDPFLSVATAAKALGTSETRLSRAINLGLEISFSTWINQYRIEQVARQLPVDDAPIMEIAQRCSFNSKASFHRCFRTVKGCTPTEFRASRSSALPGQEPHPALSPDPPLTDK